MAILTVPTITSGATLAASSTSTDTFKADPIFTSIGGLDLTQNMLLGAIVGVVVKSLLSKGS